MADKSSGDKLLYCSFCGKSQHEVRKLIAGPSVFICDECIELCNDIIREEGAAAESARTDRNKLPTPHEKHRSPAPAHEGVRDAAARPAREAGAPVRGEYDQAWFAPLLDPEQLRRHVAQRQAGVHRQRGIHRPERCRPLL